MILDGLAMVPFSQEIHFHSIMMRMAPRTVNWHFWKCAFRQPEPRDADGPSSYAWIEQEACFAISTTDCVPYAVFVTECEL
jgi:hypothetical protein